MNLHPTSGARFIFLRDASAPELRYSASIYRENGETLCVQLRWNDKGEAVFTPSISDRWTHGEAIKLARVLKRSQQGRMSRWRG